MDLNELRNKIDTIDTELVRLFSERMEIAGMVADYKKANNLCSRQRTGNLKGCCRKSRAGNGELYPSAVFHDV